MLDQNSKTYPGGSKDSNARDDRDDIAPSSYDNDVSDDGVVEPLIEPKKKLIRQTNWRWLMLSFGCFFLMGSYFCFDNPAPLKHTLQEPPFDLSNG